jgi:membrane fusion protein (multidrug efflux system)
MHDVAKPVKTHMKSKLKTMGIAIGGLVALVAVIVGIKGLQIGKMMSTPMVVPSTTVSSVTVKEEDWAPTLSAVGSISPVQGAVVSSELGG